MSLPTPLSWTTWTGPPWRLHSSDKTFKSLRCWSFKGHTTTTSSQPTDTMPPLSPTIPRWCSINTKWLCVNNRCPTSSRPTPTPTHWPPTLTWWWRCSPCRQLWSTTPTQRCHRLWSTTPTQRCHRLWSTTPTQRCHRLWSTTPTQRCHRLWSTTPTQRCSYLHRTRPSEMWGTPCLCPWTSTSASWIGTLTTHVTENGSGILSMMSSGGVLRPDDPIPWSSRSPPCVFMYTASSLSAWPFMT